MTGAMTSTYRAGVLMLAFGFGLFSSIAAAAIHRKRKRQRALHCQACMRGTKGDQAPKSMHRVLLDVMRRNSLGRRHGVFNDQGTSGRASAPRSMHRGKTALNDKVVARIRQTIAKSGCEESVNVQGVINSSVGIGMLSAAALGTIGLTISVHVAFFGCVLGALVGGLMPMRVLHGEARKCCSDMENGLSNFLEVICVGLHSGLTFDRSLDMFCRYFDTEFSHRMKWAKQAWSIGVTTRDEALRHLAHAYDSRILGQVFECVIRSHSFGSPLVENLESLAVQVRANRETASKERAMKVPVKMMVPIGTMLLPSMLLLVLGPALLNIAQEL